MQLVPKYGAADAATRLGWPPDYDPTHPYELYFPQVSIKLGANYLAHQRNYFGGNLFEALAAYDAGPGIAYQWSQLSGNDPDLFLETIRYAEPRQYIRSIYEIYAIYHTLYSPTP